MNVPDYLHQHVAQLIAIETDAAINRTQWAAIYGLKPFRDGNQWCVLLGDDIQRGIAGFGETPEKAIYAFQEEMRRPTSTTTGRK